MQGLGFWMVLVDLGLLGLGFTDLQNDSFLAVAQALNRKLRGTETSAYVSSLEVPESVKVGWISSVALSSITCRAAL